MWLLHPGRLLLSSGVSVSYYLQQREEVFEAVRPSQHQRRQWSVPQLFCIRHQIGEVRGLLLVRQQHITEDMREQRWPDQLRIHSFQFQLQHDQRHLYVWEQLQHQAVQVHQLLCFKSDVAMCRCMSIWRLQHSGQHFRAVLRHILQLRHCAQLHPRQVSGRVQLPTY